MTSRQSYERTASQIVDAYYDRYYGTIHSSGSLGDASSIMHRRLEAQRGGDRYPVTLELGSGNFEHYPFVRHARDRYLAGDIRVPHGCDVYRELEKGQGPSDLEFVELDATDLPFADASVDRVVAGCLMIHLPDPLQAIQEWQRVCVPDGVIDFLVPCDPGVASRTFRRLVSQRAVRRMGVAPKEYRLVSAIDHVNSFPRVKTLVEAGLDPRRKLTIRYFPFAALPSWNLNAFAIFSAVPQ